MNSRIKSLISRKFLLAVLALVCASLLVAFKCIDGGVYATVMAATVGGYLVANVAQKAKA
jgi:hypothetical protein